MAKVTLILEDIKKADGTATIRLSVESDNSSSPEYTPAETVAEQLYEIVLSQASQVTAVHLPNGDKKSHLN